MPTGVYIRSEKVKEQNKKNLTHHFEKGHSDYNPEGKGKFQKGNKGYWAGKKRPNLWNGSRLDMEGKHFSPDTEIKKGQHLSKETEFKNGHTEKEETKQKRIKTQLENYSTGKIKVWNTGIKGGTAGSFKKGKDNPNYEDGMYKKRKRNSKATMIAWCQANNTYRVPPHCVIHHINQDPLDNRPENLQLMDFSFHTKLHREFHRLNKELVINN